MSTPSIDLTCGGPFSCRASRADSKLDHRPHKRWLGLQEKCAIFLRFLSQLTLAFDRTKNCHTDCSCSEILSHQF